MHFLKTLNVYTVLLLSISASAQIQNKNITIQGKIFNQYNKPIENVSVLLNNAKDSTLIKASFTNNNGEYVFEHINNTSSYYIVFSALGFITTYGNIFAIDTQSIILPTTILQPETKKLSDVVVTANKPPFENKPGKIIMNVSAILNNAGINTLELLERAPGISTENNGGNTQISLKGSTDVLILIDGKSTHLSNADLSTMLKTISASTIDKIEIITSVAAKYDASGNAGVINIITTRSKQLGLNGNASFSYIQGIYPQINTSANFNYRKNKINLFGNYNYVYDNYKVYQVNDVRFRDSNKELLGHSESIANRKGIEHTHDLKLGLDYTINKNHLLGISLSGIFIPSIDNGFNTDTLSNKSDINNTILKTNTNATYNIPSFFVSLSYKGILNKTIELNIDADYANYIKQSDQFIYSQAYDTFNNKIGNLFTLNRKTDQFIHIYAAKIDLTKTLKNGVKIFMGIKKSFLELNDREKYLKPQGMKWMEDNQISKHFLYQENIDAGYISSIIESKKWNIELGLRLENDQIMVNELFTNTLFNRFYLNLFPNLSITHHINVNNDINFSYTQRIQRPNYQDLNPAAYFYDSLNFFKGNPYLQPALSNNIEFNYSYKNITTTLNYSNIKNVIVGVVNQDIPKQISYEIKDNFNCLNIIGLSISAPFNIQKWWKCYAYMYIYSRSYKGFFNTDPVFLSSNPSAYLKLNTTFNLTHSLTFEIGGFYSSKRISGVALVTAKPYYTITTTLAKTILKNKGSLALTTKFIPPRGGYVHALYSNIDVIGIQQYDQQRVGITFNYKFGKQTIAKPRQYNSSAEEEKARTGG